MDDDTVTLTGTIDSSSLFRFELVFDEQVETVVLNSSGGYTYEALQIGRVLKDAGVDVVVTASASPRAPTTCSRRAAARPSGTALWVFTATRERL